MLASRAFIDMEGDRTEVSPGSVVYDPKGVRHRFVDIGPDLEVLAVFAPPEST